MAEIYKSKFPGQEIDERLELIPELQEGVEAAQQAADEKYTKPASGIPMTDLSDEVKEAIEEGGGQADWAQTDTTAPDYIKNKPSIPTHVVRFVQQFLSDSERIQARANIGAGTYTKPSGGIPESDLAPGVIPTVPTDVVKYSSQSLTDAEKTQARTNIGAAAAAALTALETAIAAKYTKPSSGIPETDLASGVQSALALARTSIQSLADYYDKTEIDSLIAAVSSEQYVDVATLPTASASTLGKIYLVGPTNGVYERYYTSYDGTTYSWVGVGTTEINLANYATKAELSQLGQELEGVKTDIEVVTTLNGYGIASGNGYITDSARTDYSVRTYILELGKSYHVLIPKLTNKYTAAYGFFPESSASSPGSRFSTLPSEVIVGPITDYEFDVFAPSSELLCLVVCYETAYSTPTVTTQVGGLKQQVESLEDDVNHLEESMSDVQEEIDDLTERTSGLENDVQEIITNVDETIYENSGQIAYYENGGTITGWPGVGTYTPALAERARINKIILPPFQKNLAIASLKYLIGHRPYAQTGISNPKTDLTVLAEGEITDIEINTFISNYAISLASVATIPAGNQIVVLLYSTENARAFLLGGGNVSTEMQVYNSDDARAFIHPTPGSSTPFEQSWSIASGIGTTAQYKVCNPILKLEIDSEISKAIHQEVPSMLNTLVPPIVDEYLSQKESINVHLPNKLYAVVGDKLQLFYRGIIEAIDPYAYDIDVRCAKGNAFPRYFSFTPAAGDVGTYDLTINVRDKKGAIVGTSTCILQVVAEPSSPVSVKKVFTFGDSLTAGGQWPCEANRRLTKTNTVDGITGKGLVNIDFCGRKEVTLNDTLTKFFGVGGWTWNSYVNRGSTQYRVQVAGVSSVSVGAVYSNNGSNFTIDEVNITAGTGNLLLTRSTGGAPSASGTLTKVSGIGDNTIAFSSYTEEPANPLWDEDNNKMSFIPYVTEYGSGSIDAVYVLLSWNGQAAWKQYDLNDTTQISKAKTFLRTLHTEYPSAKAKICGIQMPSVNGGLGNNYGAEGTYTDRFGLYVCAFSYNKALQDLCNDAEFSGYCEFVDVASQFDSENNMPEQSVKVNVRNSKTETQGTNGVHPAESGYYQIGDAIYRNFVANFCQSE